jgi:transglutaminase-like putative cysteine protease
MLRLSIKADLAYQLAEPADLLLALEVAQLPDQRLDTDRLIVYGTGPLTPVDGEESIGRRTWTHGSGRMDANYTAVVEIDRPAVRITGLRADEKRTLPALVTGYLWPSRYCDADRFETFVRRTFAGLAGGDLILAMSEWIRTHVDYVAGVSDISTIAGDTFVERRGVCRDFAHLMITFARAAGIPARMVAAYAYQLDPPDFHAVCEVWLEGSWHLIDAIGLAPCDGIVRIGVGRDATDVSFLTVFGTAQLIAQSVSVMLP